MQKTVKIGKNEGRDELTSLNTNQRRRPMVHSQKMLQDDYVLLLMVDCTGVKSVA